MNNKSKLTLQTILLSAALALILTGCSDDEPKQQASKAHNPWDHSHEAEVTDIQKHVFEHEFAAECVDREVKNSINKDNDRKRFAKPCMCIATFMMKDLTAIEAEKFLKEKKTTQSLRIRFESAAYHCLQEKEQPKSLQLFNRR
ncbi:MAG: hypothetical protein HON51_10940 [Gammaproteobacteria bacterium]|jgi:PBP1b-binding outer membrane lipoprotein LpoB|nr:hypothetical protein [Gammaproteobacteria bacterium]MBT5222369.1 hypothetical protein [Gammaproteobacteria bacterium]MBT6576718.1 hypothetical protein [Gammaproteobacteria bacterium]MBT7434796.1 hypothetical protein [Gammaproteobacteria bacterium]